MIFIFQGWVCPLFCRWVGSIRLIIEAMEVYLHAKKKGERVSDLKKEETINNSFQNKNEVILVKEAMRARYDYISCL